MNTSNYASWQLTNTTLTLRHLQREWPVCLRFSNSSTTCWWSWCYQYFVVRNHVCSPSFDCFFYFINNGINGNRFVLNLTIQNWRCGFWPQRFPTWWKKTHLEITACWDLSLKLDSNPEETWNFQLVSIDYLVGWGSMRTNSNFICIGWRWRVLSSSCTGGCMTFAFACINISSWISWIEANMEYCKATLRNDLKVTSLCQKILKKEPGHQKDEKVCVCIPLSTSRSIWTSTVITINWLLQL